jgi:molecular chaperone DnaK (HSP70)
LTRDLLERTETTTSLVIKEQGLDWPQVDRILLVGGASRMPSVREMLRRVTGKEPDCSQSPDEAVAHGAALYAAMLMGQGQVGGKKCCDLINVNSHSLGVVGLNQQTRERVAVVLIPRNTALPCRAVRTFHTARDNQRTVVARIFEGESHRPEECIQLGECHVRDLPPGLPRGTAVEVQFSYAASGLISVSARVGRHSGHCEIHSQGPRDLGDLVTWRKKLLGRTPEIPATNDLHDGAGVLRGLDALYLKLGTAAVALKLRGPLARSQQTAAAAAEQRTRAQEQVRHWEHARQRAVDRAEVIRADAALAQARDQLQQAITQHDFALLALGRECANAGVCPSGLEREFQEVCRLQRYSET